MSANEPTLIHQVMSAPAVSVTLEHSVAQVLQLSQQKGVSGFPVVDKHNKVVGVISTFDLITEAAVGQINCTLKDLPETIKVAKDVITMRPSTPIKDAILALIKHRIGRIIITDRDNNLCGVLSRKDLVKFFIRHNGLDETQKA